MFRKILKFSMVLMIILSFVVIPGCKSDSIKIERSEADPVVFAYDKKPVVETINPGQPPLPVMLPNTDLSPVEPVKLFDNLYYVGTSGVGSFVIDTGDGLIMIDAGWGLSTTDDGKTDTAQMADDIRTLGLNPSDIKLILLSHEHVDHIGGVPYLKHKVCPNAKVAMSLIGWNDMVTRPAEMAWSEPRPKSIDIFLEDGQLITLGDTTVQVVYTPGHSIGCVSFIFPVKDNGAPHIVGLMGGSAVSRTWAEVLPYYHSVDYFQGYTRRAKCDVGLAVHPGSYWEDFEKLRVRQAGEPNPLVIGTERFETEYLQKFRDRALSRMESLPPDRPVGTAPA